MIKIREFFSILRQIWLERRLEAARVRFNHLLSITPRYWSAASIGGQAGIQLGKVTQEEAMRVARSAGHVIAHVDVSGAFIALEGDPRASDL